MPVNEFQMLKYRAWARLYVVYGSRRTSRSLKVGHSSTIGTSMRSAWRLMKVMSGETKRLIINLPPRSLKSSDTTPFFFRLSGWDMIPGKRFSVSATAQISQQSTPGTPNW